LLGATYSVWQALLKSKREKMKHFKVWRTVIIQEYLIVNADSLSEAKEKAHAEDLGWERCMNSSKYPKSSDEYSIYEAEHDPD
jgi:hypothetical protein